MRVTEIFSDTECSFTSDEPLEDYVGVELDYKVCPKLD